MLFVTLLFAIYYFSIIWAFTKAGSFARAVGTCLGWILVFVGITMSF